MEVTARATISLTWNGVAKENVQGEDLALDFDGSTTGTMPVEGPDGVITQLVSPPLKAKQS